MGLNTIVRDANVESQIFENQSTIVAIAAQSRANLGDVYNSTQVYLNAGIEDRVALSKFQPEELNSVINKGNKDNTFYAKLFNFLLYVRDNQYLKEEFPDKCFSYHDYRDSDINTFIPSIEEITKKNLLCKNFQNFRIQIKQR